jgi:plastocyanin
MRRTNGGLVVAMLAAGAIAGCGGDDEEPAAEKRPKPALKTVTISSVPPGKLLFEPRRLKLRAGTYRIVLDNREEAQHNVRIQTGRKCCWKGKDVGGTNTTSEIEKISGTAKLAPGEYVYLCTVGSHWRGGMTGRITVTQ